MMETLLWAAAALLAGAQDEQPLRTITVRVATDEEFRQHPDWEQRARNRVRVVSDLYTKHWNIRFEIVDFAEWKSTAPAGEEISEKAAADLLAETGTGKAEIIVGFSSKPSRETAGHGIPFSRVAIVTDHQADEDRTDEEGSITTLAHEIAHLFGMFHVADPESVMYRAGNGLQFNDQALRYLRLMRNLDFARGVAWIDAELAGKLLAIYEEGHDDRPIEHFRPAGAWRKIGNELCAQGKRKEALDAYRQAVKTDPRFSYGRSSLGEMLIGEGFLEEGIGELREAVRLHPSHAYTRTVLGNALDKKGLVEEALAEFREAIRIDGDNSWSFLCLVGSLRTHGRAEELIAETGAAVRRKPSDSEARSQWADALKTYATWEEIEAGLRELIRLGPDSRAAHLDLARHLKKERKWAEAEAEFREVLRQQPDYFQAHFELAEILYEQGKPEEAIEEFRGAAKAEGLRPTAQACIDAIDGRLKAAVDGEAAVAKDPGSPEARYGFGVALKDLGRLEAAEAAFREAVRLDPNHAAAHFDLAILCYRKRKLDEAVAESRETVRLDPKHKAKQFLDLAVRYSQSVAACREAIAADAKNIKAHCDLGAVYVEMAWPEEALAELREALRLDPAAVAAHNGLGMFYARQGRPAEAAASYREAVRLNPGDQPAHVGLAAAYQKQNRLEPAVAEYRAALKIASNGRIHSQLAECLVSLGRNGEAWEAVRQVQRTGFKVPEKLLKDLRAGVDRTLQINPGSREAYGIRGQMRYEAGDYDGAIGDFTKAIEIEPSLASDYAGRAGAWMAKKRYEEAIADYSRVIELNPRGENAFLMRATCRGYQARWAESVEDFSRVIELKPDGWIYYYRGCMQYNQRRWAEASADCRKALELLPKQQEYPRFRIWLSHCRLGEREAATAEWKEYLGRRGKQDWYASLSAYLVGDLPEEQLLEAMKAKEPVAARWQQFEGFFCIGLKALIGGDDVKAAEYLQKCLDCSCNDFFIELSAAAELEFLKKK